MEFCAVQAPAEEPRYYTQGFHVAKIPNGPVIAVFCQANGRPEWEPIVKFQVTTLFRCVKDGWKGDLESVTESAFRMTDAGIKRLFGDTVFKFAKEFGVIHSTKKSSIVVIVDSSTRLVSTAGRGPAMVELLGSNSCCTIRDAADTRVVQRTWGVRGRHVAIASYGLQALLAADLSITLESWIRSVGLVEACKAIVGTYKDSRKTLIVITLKKDVHLPSSELPSKTKLPRLNHEPWERFIEMESKDQEYRSAFADPLAYVRPLKDGESKQVPEPIATLRYLARKLVEPGVMTVSISPGLEDNQAESSKHQRKRRKLNCKAEIRCIFTWSLVAVCLQRSGYCHKLMKFYFVTNVHDTYMFTGLFYW